MAGFCCHCERGDAILGEAGTSIVVPYRSENASSLRRSQ
jgi:hypothetical protein